METILQKVRMQYQPKLPRALQKLHELKIETVKAPYDRTHLDPIFPKTAGKSFVKFLEGEKSDHKPLRVGVVFSGGQAPGGHNVISGLYDALKKLNTHSQLYGFLNGPSGVIENRFIEITEEVLAPYRNQGGFDLIGSGRTKIETTEQFQQVEATINQMLLDGLVIIGGDDSNTNAAFLAEYFVEKGIQTRVVGVPKTIDGDLKNDHIEISFGFDTASKTYSELIGNILKDALSSKKYYHFIKLMGRSASHLALECALQTHPNMVFISEEVEAKARTLSDITHDIANMICERAENGKNYGVILIPEGLIEFIPECKKLIQELNQLLINTKEDHIESSLERLTPASAKCFNSFPESIQKQLLIDRDSHGNVQVSKIETERLLLEMTQRELDNRKKAGNYKGKFNAQPHFYGYEGRSCMPSNFDCQYCYILGHISALLIDKQLTGYICCVEEMHQPVEDWQIGAVPIVSMMHLEHRSGKQKAVIKKALVNLDSYPFRLYKEHRNHWKLHDDYHSPGSIQFAGPVRLTEAVTLTLEYESTETIEFEELNYETILQKPWVT